MKRCFFFDIDGTLLPFGQGLPESARRALMMAHEEGHMLFIATGRSMAEVDLSIFNGVPFDGGVFSAGAVVSCHGSVIHSESLPESDKSFLIDYFSSQPSMHVLYQTEKGTLGSSRAFAVFHECMERYVGAMLRISSHFVTEGRIEDPILKLLFMCTDRDAWRVRKDLGERFDIVDNTVGVPQDIMGELMGKGITKAAGIRRMMDHLGMDIKCSVAVGDGANDVEMIREAGFGIAMGNAAECLKAEADYITGNVEQNGLENAIRYILSEKC